MKISFVLPTFNRAFVKTGVIKIILNKKYKNVEIVTVDDGRSSFRSQCVFAVTFESHC